MAGNAKTLPQDAKTHCPARRTGLGRRLAGLSLAVLIAAAAACSEDTGGTAGSGGASAGSSGQGGSTGSGGASSTASGGSSSSSSSSASAGGAGSSGTSSKAGTTASTSSGGDSSPGGKTTGGTSATGGRTGGTSALGGTSTTGGSQGGSSTSSTGQAGQTTGGTSATGGTSTTGGKSTGGSTATGGTSAGGITATGGTSAGGSTSSGTSGAYNPCPAAGTECLVLPLGDSITEGYGASGNVGGYRMEIFRLAVADNKNIKFVGSLTNGPTTLAGKNFPRNHEGHGGWTIAGGNNSSGIAGSVTDKAMSNYKPHIVLLMIGTNDVNGNIDVANAPTRLKSLVNSIITASPTTLVVVASIIPIENTGNQKVKTYNESVKSMADAFAKDGKHVVFLDNYAAFITDAAFRTKWMSDYLHPNDTGYAVLGKSWYSVIGPLLR